MGKVELYQKRPVLVPAIQWDGTAQGIMDIRRGFPDIILKVVQGKFVISTLEGPMELRKDDWVLQGVEGEYYPCKPSIFDKTYRRYVEDPRFC